MPIRIENLTALQLLLMIMACWRLASLVANENGPWHIFRKFRKKCLEWCRKYRWCDELHLYELVECEWCNSIWFGFVIVTTWYFIGNVIFWPLLILSLSAGAVLVKYVVQTLENLCNYVEKLGDKP